MSKNTDTVELGKGEVAALVRGLDWSTSGLGLPHTWQQPLRTIVSLMLNSKFPMFAAWGPELSFIYNDAYIEILGQKHPAALGKPFQEIWSEIWSDISPIIDKAMAGEPSFFEDLPFTLRRKGYDEQTWFTFSYSPLYDTTGHVAGMYCACTETTQHVLAKRQRLDELEHLRGLFQQAPGIIAVLRDADHVFEIANDAYVDLVGRRNIIGKSVAQALPEVSGQGFIELLDHVFETGTPYRGYALPVKLKRQEGEKLDQRYVDFIYQPIRNSVGTVAGIFVEGADVTETVLATQALRENEQRLRQLVNTIPHMAWMARPDGYLHWFNDRFFEYTNTTQEEVEGWRWLDVLAEGIGTTEAEFKALIAKGEAFEMIKPLRASTGEYRSFFIKAAPLHDSSGKIIQWFGTNTDIHEIEQVQEELRSANQRKDEFLAMLAHELRNPLAPIRTSAELLKLGNLDPERVTATSEIILRQVAHMTDLVDDLLDVSRVTRGLVAIEKEPVQINRVVRDAIEQVRHLAEAKHQQFDADLADEQTLVSGDKTRLTQIFSNLLNNAVRYSGINGTISLAIDAGSQNVEVRIQDAGMGIEPTLLPHIFDLFTQAERSPDRALGGLGLGLALVKSLVQLHGGTVHAHSKGANQGSEFIVTLPRVFEAMETNIAVNEQQLTTKAATASSIIVVDDNIDAARSLCLLLECLGYDAYPVYSAGDALDSVCKHNPQVVILDIGLPGMSGLELVRHLKARPETSVTLFIALTGYGQRHDREASKAAGFSHHLVKPLDIQALLSLLADADIPKR